MGLVREELETVLPAIDAAHSATVTGIGQLAEITAETSSDEVAVHLAKVWDRLDSARQGLAGVRDPVTEARDLAGQADARTLDDLMDLVERDITAAHGSLGAAMSLAETELRAAAAWGDPPGGGPGGRPIHSTKPVPPPHIQRPGNAKGPLREDFRPGVHDDTELFQEKERAIADWLMEQNPGHCIHPR
jgi:hypothetical protein